MQQALEMRNPCDRAELLISVIGRYLELTGQTIPELDRHKNKNDEQEMGDLLVVNFRNKPNHEYSKER